MKTLFTGLYNLFAPAGTKPDIWTNLSGKLYLTEAPQETTYPYATYNLIANDYDWMFDPSDFEEFLIQFSIFDDNSSADNITTYYENLKTLYDWSLPVITGYNVVHFIREFAELLRLDDVWHYVIQYRILVEKQ